MKDLQQLKSVIQAAVPDIGAKHDCPCPDHETRHDRPIRLADVLLVANKADKKLAIQDYGCWMILENDGESIDWQEKRGKSMNWDLANDSLESQSPQCQEFLINLLCK